MNICVTCDDLQPLTLPLFYQYFVPLKKNHPNLKVTFFCTPFNKEFTQDEKNDISKSEEFKKWFKDNKKWVEIHPHGLFHTKPPENKESYDEQIELISKSAGALSPYIELNMMGYKAPFYQMNQDMIKTLHKLGFSWYNQWWTTCLLKPNKKRFQQPIEIGTHIGFSEAHNPDNIDVIYDKLDTKLYDLEKLGFEYKTINEIVKEVL